MCVNHGQCISVQSQIQTVSEIVDDIARFIESHPVKPIRTGTGRGGGGGGRESSSNLPIIRVSSFLSFFLLRLFSFSRFFLSFFFLFLLDRIEFPERTGGGERKKRREGKRLDEFRTRDRNGRKHNSTFRRLTFDATRRDIFQFARKGVCGEKRENH